MSRVTHVFRQYILDIFELRRHLLNCFHMPGTVTYIGNAIRMKNTDMSSWSLESYGECNTDINKK